jgi:hypothetical protein
MGHMDHVVRPVSSPESEYAIRSAVAHQLEELPLPHTRCADVAKWEVYTWLTDSNLKRYEPILNLKREGCKGSVGEQTGKGSQGLPRVPVGYPKGYTVHGLI